MTTSSRKSYNVLALRGMGVDDMDYVEEFGLDPSVAYTPKINDVMLERTFKENMTFYIEDGMPEPEARTKAMNERNAAERNIKSMMK